jgi:hypothetical protein
MHIPKRAIKNHTTIQYVARINTQEYCEPRS